jgi:transcriptional regulator with XRE-family HTH domain
MNIGERIKQLRTDKNLTQPQLAELADIEQSYLSKLENDKSIPSSEILMAVLKALAVDIPTFLKGIDESVIERHLLQISEVAVHRNAESRLRIRQIKRWLLGAALSCAIGLALIFGGLKQLIFTPVNETLYQYVSEGIIFQGEPEDLFNYWPSNIDGRLRAGQTPSQELDLAVRMAQEEFRKRLGTDNQQSPTHKGRTYRVDVDGGYRIYSFNGTEITTNRTFERCNNWLAVLGAFLAFGGLFGFVVEFRLRRL